MRRRHLGIGLCVVALGGLLAGLVVAGAAVLGGGAAEVTTASDRGAAAGPWSGGGTGGPTAGGPGAGPVGGPADGGTEVPPGAGLPRTGAGSTPAPPPGESGAVPAYIQPFANLAGRTPNPPVPSPTGPVELPRRVDGCDRDYGAPGQCVPWQFPAGVTDPCTWLADRGLADLVVRGADRHGLDPDGDGIACPG